MISIIDLIGVITLILGIVFLLGIGPFNQWRRDRKFDRYLDTLSPEARENAIYGHNLRQ